MSEANVLYEQKGQVALITMNRPQALNSLSKELVAELIAALFKAENDEQVRVVILTGAGRAFCAGGDLNGLDSLHTTEERRQFIVHVGNIVKVIHDLEKPVIAMVNGVAAGAGFNLAISCDLVFCADNTKFIQSFVNVGLEPDCGGFYYLAKTIGLARAKELMFTARPLSAAEAVNWGLVNYAYPSEELPAKTMEFAEMLAEKAPLSVKMTKKALNNCEAKLSDTLTFEALTSSALLGTDDFKEGVLAFKEKRAPKFSGK